MSKHARHGAPPPQRNFAPLRPGEAPVYQPLPNHVHDVDEAGDENAQPAAELEAEPQESNETADDEAEVDTPTETAAPAL